MPNDLPIDGVGRRIRAAPSSRPTSPRPRSPAAQPPGTTRSRVGHHHVDLARAWLLHGNRDRAFESLHTAREVAPQLTRYHPQVRETLVVLAEHGRRGTDSLAGFARCAGVRL